MCKSCKSSPHHDDCAVKNNVDLNLRQNLNSHRFAARKMFATRTIGGFVSLKSPKHCSHRKNSEFSYYRRFEDIPGPVAIPAFGTLYQYLPVIGHYRFDRLHHNGFRKLRKFGPVVREEIVPGVFVVWLFRPEDIQMMYQCEGKYPKRRSHLALEKYRLDKPDVYNTGGLLPTNGPEWLRIRSVFQKGLSDLNSVRNFLSFSDQIINEWVDYVKSIKNINNLDYTPVLSRLFLELTCMTALDMRLNSFSDSELRMRSRSSRLIKSALTTNSCILKTDNGPQLWKNFDTPLYRKLKRSQEYMEQVAVDLLSQKMTFFDEHHKNGSISLLESYLSSPELDLKDIVGMACDFLLAGIDTSTYTTCFLLYHIARNPSVQEKLYEESITVLPDKYSKVTKETLRNCPYARAVLKESFRLNPISVGTGRVLDTEAVFSNFEVPRGTVVVSQNQVICRSPQYFNSPNKFIPERWLKDNVKYENIHPYLVLPFGHGPRSCIARRLAEQNILTFLLKVVKNFKIIWQGGSLDSKSLLINMPDQSMTLKFKSR